MRVQHVLLLIASAGLAAATHAATFGTVVPIRGAVSDIALDEARGVLYIADLSAGEIKVMNTSDHSFGTALEPALPKPVSSISLSPDGRYLVAGHYERFPDLNFPTVSNDSPMQGGVTIFDLWAQSKRKLVLADPVLGVAFGAGSTALVVTTRQFLLLDPATNATQVLTADPAPARDQLDIPVPWGTFPPDITFASTGVSADGKVVIILVEIRREPTPDVDLEHRIPPTSAVLRYRVGDNRVQVLSFVTEPPQGPRAVSVNADGSTYVAGWFLGDAYGVNRAQFPYPLQYPPGELRMGGHGFDYAHNVIYADIPVSETESPVLHVVDGDNLTVRERIQLPEMMAGRAIFSSDLSTLYAMSDRGIMILPIGSLPKTPQIAALQEDLVFDANACTRGMVSQTVDIVDLAGGNVPFTVAVSPTNSSVRVSSSSSTTPAKVRIDMDSSGNPGTSTISLTIHSQAAVNIPFPVRLVMNRHDTQIGRLINVPGKLVDVLADPVRNRLYIVRQDRNRILVFDSTTWEQIPAPGLRTGNTPTVMAMTEDQRYLIVGNNNSQLASVFDLETLQPASPILFPTVYPYSVAVAHRSIWAITRTQPPAVPSVGQPPPDKPDWVYQISQAASGAAAPCEGLKIQRQIGISPPGLVACKPPSLGIYKNTIAAGSTLAATPSGLFVLLTQPDGSVGTWESRLDRWVITRIDSGSLGGAYGALSDEHFLVDHNILDRSLAKVGQLDGGGTSSGIAVMDSRGIRSTATTVTSPGVVERVALDGSSTSGRKHTIEAASVVANLDTPPIGQIGQRILPFTRTAAVLPDQSAAVLLTQSGLTVIPSDFDEAVADPVITSIRNSADGGAALAPGALVHIAGRGLAAHAESAARAPLPKHLSSACVNVGSAALPLFSASPNRISAQLPLELTGDLPVTVRGLAGSSIPVMAHIQSEAPAVFRTSLGPTVVHQESNAFVDGANPVHPDEAITIYLTGLGRTSPETPAGEAASADPMAIVDTHPQLTLGDTSLPVTFAGLAPGQIGVYQINAYIPRELRGSGRSPLVIKQGAYSTSVELPVVAP